MLFASNLIQINMQITMKSPLIALLSLLLALPLAAMVQPGEQAPAFSLPDSNGQTRSLSDYEGNYVVLEWINHGCPFVKKHYKDGHMQKLIEDMRAKGVKWVSICSSAPGKQGYMEPAEINAMNGQIGAQPDAYLIDSDGKVGRAYGAKTTPQMVVIDPQGKIIYHGAIDSIKSTNSADVKKADNYVKAAITQAMNGEPVATKTTRPYGCSVKY